MGLGRTVSLTGDVKPLVNLWGDKQCHSQAHGALGIVVVIIVDICLHLGAHRTGSTGLQVLLNGQRAALRRAGTAYWGPARTRSGLLTGLVKNPNQLSAEDVRLGKRSCGRIQMELARLELEGRTQLVLSEENLIGTMAQNLEGVRLYGQIHGRLQRLVPAFEGHALRIGLSVRAYDMHWASQLAYRVKAGAVLPSCADMDRLVTQPRRWRNVIEDIVDVFPHAEVVVWPFEGWIGNQRRLVQALLGRSIGLGDVSKQEKSNASATADELAQLVADRGDLEGAAHLIACGKGARYMPFDADQRLKLQQDYHADLAWLDAEAEASSEGRVTYLNPTEGTFGGIRMTEGSHHDGQERGVANTR